MRGVGADGGKFVLIFATTPPLKHSVSHQYSHNQHVQFQQRLRRELTSMKRLSELYHHEGVCVCVLYHLFLFSCCDVFCGIFLLPCCCVP